MEQITFVYLKACAMLLSVSTVAFLLTDFYFFLRLAIQRDLFSSNSFNTPLKYSQMSLLKLEERILMWDIILILDTHYSDQNIS